VKEMLNADRYSDLLGKIIVLGAKGLLDVEKK